MIDGLLVGWKLASLRPDVASVRYRAMIPILGLEERGIRARIFSVASPMKLDGLDCLVIVKSFTSDDFYLACEAVNRHIPVVIDLCDNIFIDEYGKKAGINTSTPAVHFDQIAKLASLIVVTTDRLAEIVRKRVSQAVQVAVIPDGIEDKHLFEATVKKLRASAHTERKDRFSNAKSRIASIYRRVELLQSAEILPFILVVLKRQLRVKPNPLRKIYRALIKSIKSAKLIENKYLEDSHFPVVDNISPNSSPDTQRILWFGFHGAPHAKFGMLDLLLIKKELEEIAAELPVELVVVSNNLEKYEKHIYPLAIPSRYVEWSSAALAAEMKTASVVIIPNSLDAFSICKSSNRAVLSLLNGIPVVATKTPALRDLEGCVLFDDFKGGIREYLLNKEKADSDIKNAQRRINSLYGVDVVSSKWIEVLESVSRKARHQAGDERIAVVIQMRPDWDLMCPVIKDAKSRGVGVLAFLSAQLLKNNPAIYVALNTMKIRILPVGQDDLKASVIPKSIKVLISASESSLYPHKLAHRLSLIANKSGIYTATMQHGFENPGLTYHDFLHSAKKISFASRRIYLWGAISTLCDEVPQRTVNKCLTVGCPSENTDDSPIADLLDISDGKKIIGIFENLHWHRYSRNYRRFFVEGVTQLASTFSHITFLVKTHPSGCWLNSKDGEALANISNLILVKPDIEKWTNLSVNQIFPILCGVISTPSSVAVHAARHELPVALVAEKLNIKRYSPLFGITEYNDWAGYVHMLENDENVKELKLKSAQFLERATVPGNSAALIIDDVLTYM